MQRPPESFVPPISQEGLDQFIAAILAFEGATYRRAYVSGEVGEQLVARLLGAELRQAQHARGWDAWSDELGRISIKTRQVGLDGKGRSGVDMDGDYNTFVFCYLDNTYEPYIIQLLTRAEADAIRTRYKKKVTISRLLPFGTCIVGCGKSWPPPSHCPGLRLY